MQNIEVLNGHYAVELHEVEAQSAGGIVLSQAANAGSKKTQGVVVAVPQPSPSLAGDAITDSLGLAPGDTIIIAAQGGCQDVQFGGRTVQIVKGENIIAKLS